MMLWSYDGINETSRQKHHTNCIHKQASNFPLSTHREVAALHFELQVPQKDTETPLALRS